VAMVQGSKRGNCAEQKCKGKRNGKCRLRRGLIQAWPLLLPNSSFHQTCTKSRAEIIGGRPRFPAHPNPRSTRSPCAPPSSAYQTGVVRRICSSTWPRSGSCEFMRRPVWLSNAGYRAAAANRGRLFLGYFLLATQKKVTSGRATPGGFDLGFVFGVGLRE